MSIFLAITIIVLFGMGLIGTLVPGVPGIGLIYVGVLLYAFFDNFTAISVPTVVALGILTMLASVAQYIGSVWATKYAGAKAKALTGTFLGSIAGTLGGPFGIIIGGFLGALVGALLEKSTPYMAFKIALISVIGIISGSLIQFFLAIVLIISFLIAIYV
jgi:uncharacterized protein